VFHDFATIRVNAQSVGTFVTALVLLVNSGMMSRATAFEELKRYGISNPDLVWQAEQDRIQNESPSMPGTGVV
jgi:hypothetical protein